MAQTEDERELLRSQLQQVSRLVSESLSNIVGQDVRGGAGGEAEARAIACFGTFGCFGGCAGTFGCASCISTDRVPDKTGGGK